MSSESISRQTRIALFMKKKAIIYPAILIAVVFAGYFLRTVLNRQMALRGDAPSADILSRLNVNGKAGLDNIKALWQSRKIPQKIFVIEAIRSNGYSGKSGIQRDLRPIVLEALFDVDTSIRNHAIHLVQSAYSDKLPYLLPLLSDKDSEVRHQAGRSIVINGDKKYARFIAKLLEDPIKKNQIIAATGLRRWFGKDFGVRFKPPLSNSTPGIKKWQKWVKDNPQKVNPVQSNLIAPTPIVAPEIPAPDFSLKDINGKIIKLSNIKTPVIMLYFWGKPEHGKIKPMRHLKQLIKDFPDKLTILPIAVDAIPQIHAGHEKDGSHGRSCGNDEHSEHEHKIAEIKKNWHNLGFQDSCFIDDGAASFAYISNELPTTALISNGMVKRRFEGNRDLEELKSMINAANPGK